MKCVVGLLLCMLPVAGLCLDRQLHAADFIRADSIASVYANHPLTDLDLLASRLTSPLHSDFSKFRAIYRWVCDNISYDRTIYLQNKRMRARLVNEELDAWNEKITLKMFHELARHRRTVCTGYAWLVRELANRAGLRCVVIDGYGRNASSNIGGPGVPNHSWNAVRLDNQWYLCDATWSAGAFDVVSDVFVPKFNDAYFLAEPDLFIRNHYPLHPKWSLLENPLSLQQFLQAPLVYSAGIRYGIQPIDPDKFEIRVPRGDTLTITFVTRDKSFDKMMLHVGNDVSKAVHSEMTREDGGKQITLRHRLRSRGTFALNVMINTDWVLTYKVQVE